MNNKIVFNLSKLKSLTYRGTKRTFDVSSPTKSNSSQKYPLIIALHGYGGNSKSIDYVSQLSTFVEKEQIHVVFPNGYSNNEKASFFSWNAGFCCGNSRISNSDDVGFIKSLIYLLLVFRMAQ